MLWQRPGDACVWMRVRVYGGAKRAKVMNGRWSRRRVDGWLGGLATQVWVLGRRAAAQASSAGLTTELSSSPLLHLLHSPPWAIPPWRQGSEKKGALGPPIWPSTAAAFGALRPRPTQ
jgi:hypothetical protein